MKHWIVGLATAAALSAHAEELRNAASVLPVESPSFTVGKEDGDPALTVLGQIKNTGTASAYSVVLEAVFTDASGKVIDVINDRNYDLVVPAGEQAAFRLQARPAAAAAAYDRVKVRVVSAEGRTANPKRETEKPHVLKDLLISWGPMFLLIGVWIWLARKYNGKNSYQSKLLEAMHTQNELLAKQSAATESMAQSLANRPPR